MIESKHFDTTTKEGRRAQKALLPVLKSIRKELNDCDIAVWCVNRYSYRATLENNTVIFEIILPHATDAEHDFAVEFIHDMFPNIEHMQRGRHYFRQLVYGYDSLVEMNLIDKFVAEGTDNDFEIFRFVI